MSELRSSETLLDAKYAKNTLRDEINSYTKERIIIEPERRYLKQILVQDKDKAYYRETKENLALLMLLNQWPI